ncbi:primary amine oxidase-like [Pyrus ussuriensis x Pyrus communis]|uniref:Primary amine oxidase-like n=1 Tax=Pyrus ussuriensis x Pyrus communis TaxID=2448454 RepID=A0A5N5GTF3_9ROSA|nr:primary amine oxidase-like [Pyrus ussuriensis x Pyrus communis]
MCRMCVSDFLDCTTNSAWCSSKNSIQSKPPIPTPHLKDHSSDTPTTLSTLSPSKNSMPSAPSSTPTRSTPLSSRNPTSPSSSDGSTTTLSSTKRPVSLHV